MFTQHIYFAPSGLDCFCCAFPGALPLATLWRPFGASQTGSRCFGLTTHGPKRSLYSSLMMNALTICAATASPPNSFSFPSQKL
jgi:hypothetical protein